MISYAEALFGNVVNTGFKAACPLISWIHTVCVGSPEPGTGPWHYRFALPLARAHPSRSQHNHAVQCLSLVRVARRYALSPQVEVLGRFSELLRNVSTYGCHFQPAQTKSPFLRRLFPHRRASSELSQTA